MVNVAAQTSYGFGAIPAQQPEALRASDESSFFSQLTLAIATLSFMGMLVLFITVFSNRSKIAYVRTDEILSKYQGMVEAQTAFQSKADVWQSRVDTLKQS